MPDLERYVDSLSIHVAKTDEEKKIAKAFIDGKNYARYQMCGIILIVIVIISFIKTM